MTLRVVEASDTAIVEAAEMLRAGGLVAFPTETVYGLGANALDSQAVASIFDAKGRPQFNPLIVHVPDLEEAEKLVRFNDQARMLAHRFWPGPLTLILPRLDDCPVSDLCSAGLSTLAVRVPAHPLAQKLLKSASVPLAAPSANKSGHISPTVPAHVIYSLGDRVDMVLADGACRVGLESTVIDLSEGKPVVLRPGHVSAEDLSEVLGLEVSLSLDCDDKENPKSPGQVLRHYAPRIPVRLNAIDLRPGEAILAFGSDRFMGVRGGGAAQDLPETARRNLSEGGDLVEAAANLFRMLHDLDQPEHTAIAIMNVPDKGLGLAINDRLRRAADVSSVDPLSSDS